MPPSPLYHATRAPLKSRSRRPAKRAGSSVIRIGLRLSGAASTLKNIATSATDLAIGPLVESGDHVLRPALTRPGDGRNPTMLQNAAGFRSDPPVSLPSAIGTMPHASDTAAPPLLPPHVRVRSYGFFVAPNTVLNVFDPAPNSGVFVLPTVIAPAFRINVMIGASFAGTLSRKNGEPYVVRIPFVSTRSLCAIGSPCSGPRALPFASSSSAAAASAIARSATSVTIEFTDGFTRS